MEIDKLTLENLYIIQNKTSVEIANIFGFTSSQTILNKLRKCDIPIRHGREAQHCIEIDYNLLYDLYINNKYSILKIAQILGINSEETVRRLLKRNGIDRRSKTWCFGGHNKGKSLPLEQRMKLSETRKSMFACGELVHWNEGNHWPIEVRNKISQTLLNGHDPAPSYYGADWKIQRTSCLQRDDYMCQQCGSIYDLEVHHWEPYRFSFDNSLENLITLCGDCHNEIHRFYIIEGFITEREEEFYV